MSQKERESRSYSMLDVLLLDRVREAGSKSAYSVRMGIGRSTVWSWLNTSRNPLHQTTIREKLTKDMGRNAAELTELAAISVKEACDIVLDTSKNTNRAEQILKERFLGAVAEKGSDIPGAAYAIYLTGDLGSRQKLVSLLEDGEIPPAMPVEAMQFVLDQLPKPK
jgi:hypothetical protein